MLCSLWSPYKSYFLTKVRNDMNGYRKKSDTDEDSDEYLTKLTRK